jgi:hypothetical protein
MKYIVVQFFNQVDTWLNGLFYNWWATKIVEYVLDFIIVRMYLWSDDHAKT